MSTPSRSSPDFEGGINAFLDPSKRIKGISTGFTKFDEMTGGLHAGELIILAARPSMGKTALALNIAQHVATNLQDPKTVAVFSLEMSQRVAADAHALRRGARWTSRSSAPAISTRTSAASLQMELRHELVEAPSVHRRHCRRRT